VRQASPPLSAQTLTCGKLLTSKLFQKQREADKQNLLNRPTYYPSSSPGPPVFLFLRCLSCQSQKYFPDRLTRPSLQPCISVSTQSCIGPQRSTSTSRSTTKGSPHMKPQSTIRNPDCQECHKHVCPAYPQTVMLPITNAAPCCVMQVNNEP
jgi:hypothetical protein